MRRVPTTPPGHTSLSYLDRVRWVEVTNVNAEDAPGGSLLRVTGGGTTDDDETDDYGIPEVDQPDADGLSGLLVAHPAGIAAGGRGLATPADFVPVAYDDAHTPAVGETWGSAAGSWKLTKGKAGWMVAAPPIASQDLVLVECWRSPDRFEWFIAEILNDTSPYTWQERVQTAAGTWGNGPRSGTTNAYQAQPSTGAPPTPEVNDLVLMRVSPTVTTGGGLPVYEFVFDTGGGVVCEITPSVRRELIGVYQVKSGANVTDVYQRFQNITTDVNGCVSRGEPYCVVAPTECGTSRDPAYYCIDAVCWEYYDGLTPATFDAGPFETAEACDAGCPVENVIISGCSHEFPPTITGTWGSNPPPVDCHTGSFTLTWNGTAWVGTFSGCTGVLTVTLTPAAFSGGTATWTVTMTRAGYTYTAPPAGVSCGLLSTSVGSIFVSGADSGNVSITFTE